MNKDNAVYTYNRILFNDTIEGNLSYGTTLMDLKNIMPSDMSQTQKCKYFMTPFI